MACCSVTREGRSEEKLAALEAFERQMFGILAFALQQTAERVDFTFTAAFMRSFDLDK